MELVVAPTRGVAPKRTSQSANNASLSCDRLRRSQECTSKGHRGGQPSSFGGQYKILQRTDCSTLILVCLQLEGLGRS
ncbi:hypothetical protein KCU72_g54, partial [Aureobasidium melanogenum]